MTRTKKQSTEAAVREIRRKARRKFAPEMTAVHGLPLLSAPTIQLAQAHHSGCEHCKLRELRNRRRIAVIPETDAIAVGLVVVRHVWAVIRGVEQAVEVPVDPHLTSQSPGDGLPGSS